MNGLAIWIKYSLSLFSCSQVLGSIQEAHFSIENFLCISPKRPSEESKQHSMESVLSGSSGQLTHGWLTQYQLICIRSQVFSNPKMDSFFFLQLMCIWNSSFEGMLVFFLTQENQRYTHWHQPELLSLLEMSILFRRHGVQPVMVLLYLGYLVSEKCTWPRENSLLSLNHKNSHGYMGIN